MLMAQQGIDPELAASYERCRRIHRRHDPTYYWATRRLPPDVRPAVHALYGFVRGADELVDGPRRQPGPEARRAALDRWEGELDAGRRNGRSSHPVIAALVDAERRHDLPLDELGPYMRSMRTDAGPVRMATYHELEGYMRGSAASVGLIMAPLLGAPAERHASLARLGMAFQLTNFLRDVAEDYALDRVYLPAEDRDRFGVGEEEIARGQVTGGFRALMALEVARARELFHGTAPAIATLDPRVQTGIRLARAVYLRVLDHLERIGFDVFSRRPGLSPWQTARTTLWALGGRELRTGRSG